MFVTMQELKKTKRISSLRLDIFTMKNLKRLACGFSRPDIVVIEVSSACDATCTMCEHKYMERPKKFMDWELFKSAVAECADMGVSTVQLSFFGEPTLDPEFIRKLNFIRSQLPNSVVGFVTNGYRLSPEISRAAIDAKIDYIKVSILSDDSLKYRELMVGLDLDVVENNLTYLKTARDEACIPMKIHIRGLDLAEYEICETSYRERFNHLADEVNYRPENKISCKEKTWLDKVGPCPRVFSEFVILADGRMTQCAYDWHGVIADSPAGRSYKAVWRSRIWFTRRLNHLFFRKRKLNLCADCAYKPYS